MLGGLGGGNSGGLFGSNSYGQNSVGTYTINYNVENRPKNKESCPILAISADTRDKCLDMLRVEDYFSVKNRKIPDQLLSQLHDQWRKNSQGGLWNRGGSQSSGNLFSSGNNNGGLLGNNNSNGGLFGSNNQGGGLMGNNNNNNGGLFGGQRSGGLLGGSNNSGGGLLGNNNSGGGLFGGNNNNGGGLLGGNRSGGLFGGSSSSGGLFGGNNNSGGGLLGGNKQGGLFGGNSGGGLFSGNNSGGGLFGGMGNNNNNNGGGLFGGQKSGGLFGNNSGGGLFGGNNSGGGLFGNNSGGGLFSGQKSGGLFSGLNNNQGGGLFASLNNNNNQMGADARTLLEAQLLGAGLDFQQAQLYDLIRVTLGNTRDNYNLFGKSIGSPESQKEISNKYEERNFHQPLNVRKNDKFVYSPFDKPTFSRRNYMELCPDLESRLAHRSKVLSSKKKDQNHLFLAGRRYSEIQSFHDEEEEEIHKKVHFSSVQGTPVKKPLDLTKIYDSVRFSVTYNQRGEQLIVYLDMHLSSTCLDIKKSAVEKMSGIDSHDFSKYKLLFRNKLLYDTNRIQEIKLRENDKLYLISNSDASNYAHTSLTMPTLTLAPENILPKLTKNYYTEPSMLRISRMTEDQLCSIENFSIFNENVKVTFESVTDIRGLDLDEIVQLGHRAVEIYPESGKVDIPEAGTGLNKAAVIEFYKWSVPRKYEDDVESYELKLRNWASSIQAEFRYYDPEREVFCIRVKNFNIKSL